MLLWTPGGTQPAARMNGLVFVPPRGGWPTPGTISADDARDAVFNFLKNYGGQPGDLIPDSEKDRVAAAFGWTSWDYVYGHPGAATVLASVYLNLCLVGRPLPEDFEGDTGATAQDWPNAGDNFGRLIYSWDFVTENWENGVPKLRARQALQVQKFDRQADNGEGGKGAWRVYNESGHDRVFYLKPNENKWESGVDVQAWLNEHANAIWTAWNICYTAFATIVTFGAAGGLLAIQSGGFAAVQQAAITAGTTVAAIQALEAAERALAVAAAGGNWDQIIKALGNVASALAGIPGGADAIKQVKTAGQSVADEVVANPVVQQGIQIVAEARGDADLIIAKANAIKTQVVQAIGSIRDQVQTFRDQYVPSHLQPWFDSALVQGTNAASSLPSIPFYAKGMWTLGMTYGVLLEPSVRRATRIVHLLETMDEIERQQKDLEAAMTQSTSVGLITASGAATRDALMVALRNWKYEFALRQGQSQSQSGVITATGKK